MAKPTLLERLGCGPARSKGKASSGCCASAACGGLCNCGLGCCGGKKYKPVSGASSISDISHGAHQTTLQVHKGTISEDEHMIQRLKYQLIETYREIALIEDTDINLTGGDRNKTILSHVRNVNSANTKDAMGVRELHSTVLVLRRRLAQNNAILKQKEDEIHIIEQRVERIKQESKNRYLQASEQVKDYTLRNNELLLTLSRCQIDLMDLRKLTKAKKAAILQVTQKIQIIMNKKPEEPVQEVEAIPDPGDDEEFNDLVEQMHKLDSSLSSVSSQLIKVNAESTERANLRRQLEAANAQIKALNDQNDDLRDQNRQINDTIRNLNAEVDGEASLSLSLKLDLEMSVMNDIKKVKRENETLERLLAEKEARRKNL